MKTHAALLAALVLGFASVTTTSAGLVTFQVNMSAQLALGNFNYDTDSLVVAGDPINGWSTSSSILTPTLEDPNLWTGTFDVAGTAGATAQYKFVMITTSKTTWEGNVGPGGPSGNRTFTLSDTEQTLPVVFFDNVTSSSTVTADITFQVNMSVQIALGAFDPTTGTVSVAGDFNNWNTSNLLLAPSAADTNLWVGTQSLTGASGSATYYKFVMNGSTWEGNVGPGGAQNRSLNLIDGPLPLEPVYFNNVAAVPSTIPVTFQVNLGVSIAQGTFDPDTGTVSVAGDILNNWNGTASVLTRSNSDPNVWTGTFDINSSDGATMLFKYVLNNATWEGDVGPDGTQNRTYTFAGTGAQTVPLSHFNNIADLGTVTTGTVSNGQITLTWTAGPLIRLQTAPALSGVTWEDVPNTLGQGTTTINVGPGRAFFQLVGP